WLRGVVLSWFGRTTFAGAQSFFSFGGSDASAGMSAPRSTGSSVAGEAEADPDAGALADADAAADAAAPLDDAGGCCERAEIAASASAAQAKRPADNERMREIRGMVFSPGGSQRVLRYATSATWSSGLRWLVWPMREPLFFTRSSSVA